MAKAVLEIGYRNFILPLEDAAKLLETLSKAEIGEKDYGNSVWKIAEPDIDTFSIRVMSESTYREGKASNVIRG